MFYSSPLEEKVNLHLALKLPHLVSTGNFQLKTNKKFGLNASMDDLHRLAKKSNPEVRELLLNPNSLEALQEKTWQDTFLKTHKCTWKAHFSKLKLEERNLSDFAKTVPHLILEGMSEENPEIVSDLEGYLEQVKRHEDEQDEVLQRFLSHNESPRDKYKYITEDLHALKYKENLLHTSRNDQIWEQIQSKNFDHQALVSFDSGYSTCERRESTASSEPSKHSPDQEEIAVQLSQASQNKRSKAKRVTRIINPKSLPVLNFEGGHPDIRELERRYSQSKTVLWRKLEVKRIKCKQLKEFKPSWKAIQTYEYLKGMYKGQVNWRELLNDMFRRLIPTEDWTAKQVEDWSKRLKQLDLFQVACVEDAFREWQEVDKCLSNLSRWKSQRAQAQERFKESVDHQTALCQNLHDSLDVLRERQTEAMGLKKIQFLEEQGKLRAHEEQKQKSNRRRLGRERARLSDYKREQAQIRNEREFHLSRELKVLAQKKKEKALLDYIRVNFRRVMAQKRELERQEADQAKSIDFMTQEARLESLRRLARRQLGLDFNSDKFFESVDKTTLAYEAKLVANLDRDPGKSVQFYGYADETILRDPRLIAENILRAQGLCDQRSVVEKVLQGVQPPSTPRRDTISQIQF